jgi:hypothetical protein
MKRLCLLFLLAALLGASGCATEETRAQWQEALKDLRGDNMKMSDGFNGR